MSDKVFDAIIKILGMIVFSLVMIIISREYQIWRVTKEKWHAGYKPKGV
jgi:hypothetical protein